jgi:hypothetical protein
MIRLEIVERKGAKLYKRLIDAMRSGDLRTFTVADRGKKVTHVRHPGLMRWKETDGVITGTLRGAKGENAWQLLGAFLGRLAHKYADRVDGDPSVETIRKAPAQGGKRGGGLRGAAKRGAEAGYSPRNAGAGPPNTLILRGRPSCSSWSRRRSIPISS